MTPTRSQALLAAAALGVGLAAAPAEACRGGGGCYDEARYRAVIETPPLVLVQPEPVIVAPGRIDTVRMPAETVTVFQEVVVQPAGYSWSRTGPNGERCCAVPVPAETKLVAREVVARPARDVSVITPPAYRWRDRVVAVRPGARTVIDRKTVVTRQRTRVRMRRAERVWMGGWIGW